MNKYTYLNKINLWLLILFLSFATTCSFNLTKAKAANESLYFVVSGSLQVGNTISVQVRANSNGTQINAVEADFTYQQSVLSYLSIDATGSGFSVDAPSAGGSGLVSVARGSVSSVSSDSLVATVKFKIVAAGSSSLDFRDTSALVKTADGTNCLALKQKSTIISYANADPIGNLELAQPTQGGIRLAGWGFDRSNTNPASVHVYIDGRWGGGFLIDKPRQDVANAFSGLGIGSNTGFNEVIPYTTPGTHQVCAWVVGDNIGASSAGLGCRSLVTVL